MDQARFLEACRWACSGEAVRQGIGTLGEKTLHSAVKYYFQPDPSQREVRLGRYVADALTSQGVIEVQTRAFDRLRPKLCAFLGQGPVTLVYPVPAKKTVAWISETGEITPPRKSPLKPGAGYVLPELYKLGELLSHPSLRLCVLLLEVEEYRLLNGWTGYPCPCWKRCGSALQRSMTGFCRRGCPPFLPAGSWERLWGFLPNGPHWPLRCCGRWAPSPRRESGETLFFTGEAGTMNRLLGGPV